MLDEYKMKGPTAKLEVEVEKNVIETLQKMTGQTKITLSEMANTALKRFISSHKDFLPAQPEGQQKK